jgi:hypothetical protein
MLETRGFSEPAASTPATMLCAGDYGRVAVLRTRPASTTPFAPDAPYGGRISRRYSFAGE